MAKKVTQKPAKSGQVKKKQPNYDYDCSYNFSIYQIAKDYKFVVIHPGDLDLNGAIMIRNKKSLVAYLEECAVYGKKVLQIFEGAAILDSQVSASVKKRKP